MPSVFMIVMCILSAVYGAMMTVYWMNRLWYQHPKGPRDQQKYQVFARIQLVGLLAWVLLLFAVHDVTIKQLYFDATFAVNSFLWDLATAAISSIAAEIVLSYRSQRAVDEEMYPPTD